MTIQRLWAVVLTVARLFASIGKIVPTSGRAADGIALRSISGFLDLNNILFATERIFCRMSKRMAGSGLSSGFKMEEYSKQAT